MKRSEIVAMRNLEFQDHDRDDDGKNSITKRLYSIGFQSASPHGFPEFDSEVTGNENKL
jgi:hypothetical protein